MKTKAIVPPLKSQGIKTKLVPWIAEAVPSFGGTWVEPFLGTGVVAFSIGFERAILNDSNPHIIKFYEAVQKGKITPAIAREYLAREGAALACAGDNGYDHFRLVRDRFNATGDPLDLLFLSRAGFNGMMRFNGSGKWNIPFCKKPNRFSPSYITKIANQIRNSASVIKNGWQLFNKSFKEIIPLAKKGDVIYCDPPYFGRYVDYYNGWTEEDENELFELLSQTDAFFILSTWHHNDFRQNDMVAKYWNKFNILTKDHFYHGGGKIENRNAVVEALVLNFNPPESVPTHRLNAEQLALV
jgi:DNA adenine methylase